MREKKGHGIIFKNFVKMLVGTINKTFELKEWEKSEFWAVYNHHDLSEVLEEMESYFVEFY
jgi:hypothetical protein